MGGDCHVYSACHAREHHSLLLSKFFPVEPLNFTLSESVSLAMVTKRMVYPKLSAVNLNPINMDQLKMRKLKKC